MCAPIVCIVYTSVLQMMELNISKTCFPSAMRKAVLLFPGKNRTILLYMLPVCIQYKSWTVGGLCTSGCIRSVVRDTSRSTHWIPSLKSCIWKVSWQRCLHFCALEQIGSTVFRAHLCRNKCIMPWYNLQLSMPKVKKMSLLLNKTRSSYYPAFRTMLESI